METQLKLIPASEHPTALESQWLNAISPADFINNNSDYILTELDKWKYKGTYNPRKCVFSSSRNWVRFKDTLKTMEIRIGEMTFDYELLFERIRHCNEIVKTLKDKLLIPVVTKYDKHKANEIVSNRIIKI